MTGHAAVVLGDAGHQPLAEAVTPVLVTDCEKENVPSRRTAAKPMRRSWSGRCRDRWSTVGGVAKEPPSLPKNAVGLPDVFLEPPRRVDVFVVPAFDDRVPKLTLMPYK